MDSEIIQALKFRHACKDFDPKKKIPETLFHEILEAGRLSPSSFGFEPWRFLVVQNQDVREALKQITWGGQNQIPHSSHLVVYLAKKQKMMDPDGPYIQNFFREVQHFPEDIIALRDRRYRNFLKNDFALWDNPEKFFGWSCRQVYIALANMMTAAAFLGVDSCPMEGFDAAAMDETARELLHFDPAEYGVAVLCGFGYRVKPPREKTRQDLDRIVEWIR